MIQLIPAPRIRRWAHDNALTLIFLCIMFVITWFLIGIGLIGIL